MKKGILIMLLSFVIINMQAQKYYTKEGKITFSSDAPMEKIEAQNYKASTIFDYETGAIEWAVLIKAFEFEKALMQEHFNENYMESSKFPKAKFKGKLKNISSLDLKTNGTYKLDVSGELEIHGVKNEVETVATFVVNDNTITGTSELTVLVADYDIEIPAVVRDNIAKEVKVTIEANYQEFNR
ncbi:MAG: YceI family protein [Saprospiraceae bacterium]|nr:YceI family protein [Saprospiraceae bacterium]NNL93889.1 YceI family protein [Saprospiraceae bacterium]